MIPAGAMSVSILPLAVHFCCVDCKDQYLTNFSRQPLPLIEVESVEVEPGSDAASFTRKRKPTAEVIKKRTTRKAATANL